MVDIHSKSCTKCKVTKPLSNFRSRGGHLAHLLKSQCNSCLYDAHVKWVQKNKGQAKKPKNRNPLTLARHCSRRGITLKRLMELYEEQNGKCPICEIEIELMSSALDHNHTTGEFRGLLCNKCNRALGMFLDSEVVLLRAAQYLKRKGSYATDQVSEASSTL
jgi:hypothetical protein